MIDLRGERKGHAIERLRLLGNGHWVAICSFAPDSFVS
jgi:hypothetical protein